MNFVIKSKKKAKKNLVKKNTIKKAKKRIKRNKFSKKYNKKKNKSRKLKRGGEAGASKSYNDETIIQIHNERDYINYSLISKINKLEDINKVNQILCDLFSIFYNIYANIIYNPKLYLDRIRDQTNIEKRFTQCGFGKSQRRISRNHSENNTVACFRGGGLRGLSKVHRPPPPFRNQTIKYIADRKLLL